MHKHYNLSSHLKSCQPAVNPPPPPRQTSLMQSPIHIPISDKLAVLFPKPKTFSFVFRENNSSFLTRRDAKILNLTRHDLRSDSRFALSQWETALLCNDVSHWLGASLESALWPGASCMVIWEFIMWALFPNNTTRLLDWDPRPRVVINTSECGHKFPTWSAPG